MRLLLFAAFALLCQVPGRAQSLRWDPRFGAPGGTDGSVKCSAVFDDGTGPALYIGGKFSQAGSVYTGNIAKLGAQGWEALGPGLGGLIEEVRALKVFDDGTGEKLYVSGTYTLQGPQYTSVMSWDGSQWATLGQAFNYGRTALEVFDDGTGPALYAGGNVVNLGSGLAAIVRWTGSTWAPLPYFPGQSVYSMLAWDDGSGSKLYIGSAYTGGHFITRWDGTTLSTMPLSPGPAYSLCAFDDGTGPALYAAGTILGGVQRWNGTMWSTVGSGIPQVQSLRLAIYDDGSGASLYVGAAHDLKRLVSGSWSPIGSAFNGDIASLCAGDTGFGPRLFIGGSFSRCGAAPMNGICAWDGSSQSMPGPAPGDGALGNVQAFVARTEAGVPTLYVSGAYSTIGGQTCPGLARYQQGQWTVVPSSGLSGESMTFFDEGSGPVLITAGSGPNGIRRWNGTSWSALGSGLSGTGHALAEYDPGTGAALYVGGSFQFVGGLTSPNLGRWNGSTWSPVGIGVNGEVFALAVYDSGTGPRLYLTGTFTNVSGFAANRIASWDGTNWHALGTGLNNHGYALTVFDDGSGPALYVGGFFSHAGGQLVNGIAKWNGASFSPVGNGFGGAGFTPGVRALTVFDDGSGPKLYAGGQFATADGQAASGVARWSGTNWSALGGGTDGFVDALLPFDDSTAGGNVLMVGGTFGHASALDSAGIAQWRAGFSTLTEFCDGDGSAGHCPCWNNGEMGRGCENSNWTGGARLSASGTPNPDTLVLHASDMLPSVSALAIQGSALLYEPVNFGDGLRCIGGTLRRMYVGQAVGSALDFPGPTDPSISQRSAALGDPLLPGTVRTYQVVYRDPDPLFCTQGGAWNVTSAVRVVW